MEPSKTFLKLTIIEYSVFSLSFSIVLIFSIFFNLSSLLLSSVFGFLGISLYCISSYFTQVYNIEKVTKSFSFSSGMFSSIFRVLSIFSVFVAAAAMDTFIPSDNKLDFEDTVNIVNLWLLLYYISIPMISSFIFNYVYYWRPQRKAKNDTDITPKQNNISLNKK